LLTIFNGLKSVATISFVPSGTFLVVFLVQAVVTIAREHVPMKRIARHIFSKYLFGKCLTSGLAPDRTEKSC